MILSGIAQRYAKALHDAALAAGKADEVFADTQSLLALKTDDRSFQHFIESPQVLTDEKVRVIKTILEDRVSKLVVDLLLLLVEKKRFMFIEEILEAYRYLYEKEKGIVEVRAITAIPLEDALKDELIRKLEARINKTVRIKPEVDPNIIGGMILVMEDHILDGSIRFKLEQLQRRLGESRVVQMD
ncbi:MAG: ATP synthase F1 subunit delta [Candidatus Latescibacterota bacterium]|nr:MAG: ATP synthase F1 subunit delta [Candidatus Latescibacterota bacterium]